VFYNVSIPNFVKKCFLRHNILNVKFSGYKSDDFCGGTKLDFVQKIAKLVQM
jgi:hypothetical protein